MSAASDFLERLRMAGGKAEVRETSQVPELICQEDSDCDCRGCDDSG